MDFNIYTKEEAPQESQPLLEAAEQQMGFVPNLLGELAESPAVLEGYLSLSEIVGKTDLTPVEQQLAILAVSVENDCHYCTAAHTTTLKKQLNADADIVNAVQRGEELADERLNALVNYARHVVQSRGFVDESELKAFLNAGYTKGNVLEINLIVALKTISNYTNHIADTPLDDVFEPEKVEVEAA